MTSTLFVAVPGHSVAVAGGELVILHQTTGVYFGLNATGRRIWELIQTPLSEAEVVGHIVDEFKVTSDDATRDAGCLLQELVAAGLARTQDELAG